MHSRPVHREGKTRRYTCGIQRVKRKGEKHTRPLDPFCASGCPSSSKLLSSVKGSPDCLTNSPIESATSDGSPFSLVISSRTASHDDLSSLSIALQMGLTSAHKDTSSVKVWLPCCTLRNCTKLQSSYTHVHRRRHRAAGFNLSAGISQIARWRRGSPCD